MKHAVVAVALACAACSSRDKGGAGAGASCDGLAVSATVAQTLRTHVEAQLASAGHAFDKWQKWERKEVTSEQDGTGEYSDARKRSFAYERSAFAMCEASRVVDEGMAEAARLAAVKAGHPPDQCSFIHASDDVTQQRAAATEWANHDRSARDFEDALVKACYAKTGGKPPADIQMPSTILPTE